MLPSAQSKGGAILGLLVVPSMMVSMTLTCQWEGSLKPSGSTWEGFKVETLSSPPSVQEGWWGEVRKLEKLQARNKVGVAILHRQCADVPHRCMSHPPKLTMAKATL